MVDLCDPQIAKFVTAMPLPAAIIGKDERILATNPLFDGVMGSGLIGRHYVTAFRQPALIGAVEAVLVDGATAETPFLIRANGSDAHYDFHASDAGAFALVTLVDRTDAKNAGRMRTDFIANASHELRTPLTALMGFIETLRGAARDDPAARSRFLGIMAQEADRMTHLVDDLMALSRLEGHERIRPTGSFDICDVLRTVSQTMAPIADMADVKLMIDLPQTPVIVVGDSVELQQVFTNLIENAIKYGGAGKKVDVTVYPHETQRRLRTNGTVVTVTDFGDGIAAHHMARLTERFYRVDGHRSRQVGGNGLGLAIVKHIVNRHHGHLAIKSVVGKGTVATVTLPKD